MDKSAPDAPRVQEQQWIAGLQGGEEHALRSIYTQFGPVLYHFAQRLVSADLAEDVIQDVLIDLWERRSSLVIRGSLKNYLLGATYRRALNVQRRMRISARAVGRLSNDETLLPTRTEIPDQVVESREARAAVASAMATLPDRTRLILALRWHNNLTYEDIADILDISVAAAKKQGRRGEQALSGLLRNFA